MSQANDKWKILITGITNKGKNLTNFQKAYRNWDDKN